MIVLDRVFRERDLPDAARAYARETMTLGWEERLQMHGRRRSDGGIEFGLALPRGSVLRGGDLLVLDDVRMVVTVAERLEPVFVIEPRSAQEWALYAYQIGNRHQPMMITDNALVCPDVPGVAQLLHQHGIPHSRAMRPFTPATVAAGHSH